MGYQSITTRIKNYFENDESPYGLSAFRMIVGGLTFVSLFRYVYFGWVSRFFYEPKIHFKYPGFEWVLALPSPFMDYLIYALMLISVFFILGYKYRVFSPLLFLGFLYVHLIDQSLYLNHYYLLCWVLLIMVFLPADSAFCFLEKKKKPVLLVKKWHYSILKFQIGVVYFFAGLAKLTSDWLVHAQPMNIWMNSLVDLPLIGGLMDEIWLQYVFAWSGFLYDLTIPFWLLIPRLRPYAYVVVVTFHFFTSLFFPIGLFPYIMTFCALIFFSSNWPVHLYQSFFKKNFKEVKTITPLEQKPLSTFASLVILLFVTFHLVMPLRHFLYPGNVLWNEEGMRFSWKVMVREKNGTVTFKVRDVDTGKVWYKESHEYLAAYQAEEMSGIPDMILQMAHIIGKKYTDRGHNVEVFADSKASLNGRKFVQMIDPTVNLLDKKYSFKAFDFVMDAPIGNPSKLKSLRKGF